MGIVCATLGETGPTVSNSHPRTTARKRNTDMTQPDDRPTPKPAGRHASRPAAQTSRAIARKRPPAVDVDALLARVKAGNGDILAEIEAAIDERREQAHVPVTGDLTSVATLRQVLRRHGLRPNKTFGQNLLVDRTALTTIVEAADLQPEDSVLEVGSGTGVLTLELAARARRVVAVELDRAILPVLRETTSPCANVEIIPRDLLAVEPDEVFGDSPYKLVANLPYYITALTLRHFLESANAPRALIIMVQVEVAQRLTARPGDMSLLGLSVQFYGTASIIAKVPAASFYPSPKVDSAIVRIDLHAAPALTGSARDRMFELAHAGFAEKRKMLHNSLARNLRIPQEVVAGWLTRAGIDPARRAETLGVEDWVRLTHVVMADEQEAAHRATRQRDET